MTRTIQLVMKHVMDRLAAVVLLCLLLPVLLLIAVAILLESGRPVVFVQTRVGRQGRPFRAYKFRTMVLGAEQIGLGTTVAAGDDRIARVGVFLRTWSLDELPQLLNVLRGDMSLVGPRPTLEYQVAQYTTFQRRRLEMKPGITGWAQVCGRNALPWAKRIELDVWYVDRFSLLLDVRILFRTIGVWLRREGLYGSGGVNDDFVPKEQG
jgi:lipopolysaccharide/colanic/teichoic acid biosynthesis glycosyltransferase